MGKFTPKDRYFRKAKQEGLLSRAAFKLKQLDQKYQLLKAGQRVVDLGAAPGGWSQVALQAVGPTGQVLGVDLETRLRLEAPGFTYLQGDLEAEDTQARIRDSLPGPADVVLSDMAPSTSGIKFRDQLRSAALARQAWAVARAILKKGGHLVIKIFPGEELAPLKKELKGHFRRVQEYSPAATRKTSNELYLVALGFLPSSLGNA